MGFENHWAKFKKPGNWNKGVRRWYDILLNMKYGIEYEYKYVLL